VRRFNGKSRISSANANARQANGKGCLQTPTSLPLHRCVVLVRELHRIIFSAHVNSHYPDCGRSCHAKQRLHRCSRGLEIHHCRHRATAQETASTKSHSHSPRPPSSQQRPFLQLLTDLASVAPTHFFTAKTTALHILPPNKATAPTSPQLHRTNHKHFFHRQHLSTPSLTPSWLKFGGNLSWISNKVNVVSV